jgi:hypothetical protein
MTFLSLFGRDKPKVAPQPSEMDKLVCAERAKQAQQFIFSAVPYMIPKWPVDVPRLVITIQYDDGKTISVEIHKPELTMDAGGRE